MSNHLKKAEMHKLAQYREQLRKHPRLIYLFLELTDQCNLHCIHCGSNCSIDNHSFLPYTEIVKVLDAVKARYGASHVMICLTGGEPLLHPDFERIITTICQNGFPWGITTNGLLINEHMIALFQACNLQSITLSIDGLEEDNDFLRGRTGVYQQTLNIAAMLQKSGIRVQITTVVSSRNIQTLQALYEVLSALHISSWRLVNIEPIGRAKDHPELLLDKTSFRQLLDFIRDKRFESADAMEVTFGCSHYITLEYERTVRDTYFICGSGLYVASILCNGDIFSCLDIERRPELIQGNIHIDNFVDVWENGFRPFRMDRTALCDQCIDCTDRFLCGGDSTHTWDFDFQRPLLCVKQLFEQR